MEELLRLPPVFDPPLMNVAGTLGFSPDRRKPLDWAKFGAFITNPISLQRRRPANSTRWRVDAGMGPGTALVHTGHPNPGLSKCLRQFAPIWAQADLPVIVHLLADRPAEIRKAVTRLEVLENVIAVELGFPEQISAGELQEVVAASLGELPVLVSLPFIRAVELAPTAQEIGAVAVTLSPPRGQVPNQNGGFDQGRL
ncbi:MAG TPA: hypothetical protein VJ965_00480, partial [Anaerolineales bacterium]|nr:hypothetical protein [Anaerolineales bacterium]